jgi:hypothetical protein
MIEALPGTIQAWTAITTGGLIRIAADICEGQDDNRPSQNIRL